MQHPKGNGFASRSGDAGQHFCNAAWPDVPEQLSDVDEGETTSSDLDGPSHVCAAFGTEPPSFNVKAHPTLLSLACCKSLSEPTASLDPNYGGSQSPRLRNRACDGGNRPWPRGQLQDLTISSARAPEERNRARGREGRGKVLDLPTTEGPSCRFAHHAPMKWGSVGIRAGAECSRSWRA